MHLTSCKWKNTVTITDNKTLVKIQDDIDFSVQKYFLNSKYFSVAFIKYLQTAQIMLGAV